MRCFIDRKHINLIRSKTKKIFEVKDDSRVISITAEEKKAISAKCPNVHIVRTMRQDSKRHHYYMEESGGAMRMLKMMRGLDVPKGKRKGV